MRKALLPLLTTLAALLTGCGGSSGPTTTNANGNPPTTTASAAGHRGSPALNVYAADSAGHVAARLRGLTPLVYVPNTLSNTVTVIDQRTFRVLRTVPVGEQPQHVTPAWDLSRLYVDNDLGNTLTPVDPRSGSFGTPIPVEDPYNMYFTPDGRYAMVVAERLERIDFRDAHTMRLVHSLSVPNCPGVDHMDFTADSRYAIASCEFGGHMIKIDLRDQREVGYLQLGNGITAPQDVKLSPDGTVLYTADQASAGLWEIDPVRFRVIGFLHTGLGAHGLYPSRDASVMYVSNRRAGSVSIVSFATRRVIRTWQLPQPASPDMGGVSADGSTLWLSGRYNSVVYAIDTRTGKLRAEIPVGDGPHGLCVWPQPGRFSLGHTGIMR